eukprot:scaffold641_cov237-Pinguiococcus_pyrenoidosus.AAC.4
MLASDSLSSPAFVLSSSFISCRLLFLGGWNTKAKSRPEEALLAASKEFTAQSSSDPKGSAFLASTVIGNVQMSEDDDNDEGWITAGNIKAELAEGGTRGGIQSSKVWVNKAEDAVARGAACVTTDYAMQNVLLQMNLPLLSLQGRVIRKVSVWLRKPEMLGACWRRRTAFRND